MIVLLMIMGVFSVSHSIHTYSSTQLPAPMQPSLAQPPSTTHTLTYPPTNPPTVISPAGLNSPPLMSASQAAAPSPNAVATAALVLRMWIEHTTRPCVMYSDVCVMYSDVCHVY